MYFLNGEEKKLLIRNFLPKGRESYIDEELRGWNWNSPPLSPIYEIKLPVYEIANGYCTTARDVYLRKVERIKSKANIDMIMGKVFHETLVKFIIKAKKLIYTYGIEEIDKVNHNLREPDYSSIVELKFLNEQQVQEVKSKIQIIWDYEYNQITSRIQEVLSRQPYINEDSLVSLAIPIIVEHKLDGSFLGLSKYLSTDAYSISSPMILDLKFGRKQNFHKLCTTAYALVMESIFEFPVDVGCIVYANFKDNRLLIEKDFHIIDDELREWFIEQRDERMRMVFEGIDPGVSDDCYTNCPFYDNCHIGAETKAV